MIAFPNCKINLGLNVTAKRSDGYHVIETVFYPLPINDALEIIQSNEFQFHSSGTIIKGDPADNLCTKAYNLLKQDFTSLPNIAIHLHKNLPMGAGLGGGSSDGACMLTLINKKFDLQLTHETLLQYALKLGSDCPFFILNTPCYATGRGEELTPIELDLSAYKILLVHPSIHVSTREAFSGLLPKMPEKLIYEIILQPIETWKDDLQNNFENTIFHLHPSIQKIKSDLYFSGAIYASMTGSGSTVYAIFNKQQSPELSMLAQYFHQWV